MLCKKLKILLIEDDKIEIIKLKRAISKEFSDYKISLSKNGSEALFILENSFIDIILIDLNIPDTNVIDFLLFVKSNPKLKHIPIIILTASTNDKDIKGYYKLGIAGYLLKSLKYEHYQMKINTILKYWSLNEFILH
ncbi:MAG: CheY-like chemotaxis protein [Urechidicola sp.]|jgi:CheY-like chemotaxis protein